jgi:6,7-dimethyl-8-ribityllumazine synthase
MAEPSRPSVAPISAEGARFVIVEARFYDAIGAMLLDGAKRALVQAGADVRVVSVPGALEIPIALALACAGGDVNGAVALGCIIRGETYHFEIVANESARALMQFAVTAHLPFGNGILTVETEAQAIVRADPSQGDKGGDAARAALALYALKQAKAAG